MKLNHLFPMHAFSTSERREGCIGNKWVNMGLSLNTLNKKNMKFSVKGLFSKCERIYRLNVNLFNVLKKSLTENFIFLRGDISSLQPQSPSLTPDKGKLFTIIVSLFWLCKSKSLLARNMRSFPTFFCFPARFECA